MKRRHKIELIIVSIVILANSAFLVYQFCFNRKFLYEQAHVLYVQADCDEAALRYARFLKRYKAGEYAEEARRELVCEVMPNVSVVALEVIGPLIDALKDKDAIIRLSAARALELPRDPRAVEILIASLKDRDSYLRKQVARVLGQIGGVRARDALIVALRDRDWLVRLEAARALGKIGDAAAIEPLIASLNDKESYVRKEAAKALRQIGDARAVRRLIAALKDEDRAVRLNAASALAGLGEPAVASLVDVLKNGSAAVRQWAARVLGRIGNARPVEPLIAALKDENSDVRANAAGALGNIKDARAIDPLIAALNDDNAWVRLSAARALDKIDDLRRLESSIDELNGKDVTMRRDAAKGLARIGDAAALAQEHCARAEEQVAENAEPAVLRKGPGRPVPNELVRKILDANSFWLHPPVKRLAYTFSMKQPGEDDLWAARVVFTAPDQLIIRPLKGEKYEGEVDNTYDPHNSATPPYLTTILQGTTFFGPMHQLYMEPENHVLLLIGEDKFDGKDVYIVHLRPDVGPTKEAVEYWARKLRDRAVRPKYEYEIKPVRKMLGGVEQVVVEIKRLHEAGPGWAQIKACNKANPTRLKWGGYILAATTQPDGGKGRSAVMISLDPDFRGKRRMYLGPVPSVPGWPNYVATALTLREGGNIVDEKTVAKLKAKEPGPERWLAMRVGCGVWGTWSGYAGWGAKIDQIWVDKATGMVLREEGFADKFLFSAGLNLQSDLEEGVLSKGLREKFKDHGISLPDNVVVTTKRKGFRWRIGDAYFVVREYGVLWVCRHYGCRFTVEYSDFEELADGRHAPRRVVITLWNNKGRLYPWVFDMKFSTLGGNAWLLEQLEEFQGGKHVVTAKVLDTAVESAATDGE